MSRTLDLQPADLAILQTILVDVAGYGIQIWAFGSRVTGTARRYSDLDLAVQTEARLDQNLLHRLQEALSESDLTIKVDLIDLAEVAPAFRRKIEQAGILLTNEGVFRRPSE